MKRIFLPLFGVFTLIFLSSCTAPSPTPQGTAITDALGNVTYLSSQSKAVACNGSFADLWLLSGGTLAGVTQDAIDQGVVQEGAFPVVGTVKQLNLEAICGLNPDFVLLSADLAAHRKLGESLAALDIPHGYFRVDTFEQYKAVMAQFCGLHGREDLYRQNVLEVERSIEEVRAKIPENPQKTVLLVRVYSSGLKAKRADTAAGLILQDFGLVNIADQTPSLLEDLSLEKILSADPDYILALTMGEEAAGRETFRNWTQNLALSGVTAIKNGNCHLLPKELFHYKPNERWAESYEYLANLLFNQT